MSILRSRGEAQSSEVKDLQAKAREDYRTHNSPETRAAAREQSGHARTRGNAAGGAWRSSN
ncbi:hypothetical protein ACFVFQ_08940 [Streptomyces sp. NPDC057743]|uniref:hypothetical protein n=1 Tax=Streptomyces sp. NPDC057743 TaxID=3346236 RepID=UPI003677F794